MAGKKQYAILRFARYKGPEISRIEAHNERTKEKYASNPDVDTSRSHLNFHLVTPERKYRAEAERQIAEAGCRTRKDSVRVVEALVTASRSFFKGKSRAEVRAFFQHALEFIQTHQDPKTILSAVVHMDEKTPHMHLSFVPLTEDGRLSAKDIVGNRKKLTWWQDEFWSHMVRKYPELERGESASQTGREHIPPQLYKQMTRLLKQRRKIQETIESITPLNTRAKSKELCVLLDRYLPAVTKMRSELDTYRQSFDDLRTENAGLKEVNAALTEQGRESVLRQMQVLQMERDYAHAVEILERIPQEVLEQYAPEQPAESLQRKSHAQNEHDLENL